MSDKKQILVVEDLGVSKSTFESIVEKSELGYEVIWEEGLASPSQVEVIVTVKRAVGQAMLTKFFNVKMVAVAFTGFDSVDIDVCQKKDIAVYNVPAYSTNAVVELTLGLTIALLREIPIANRMIHDKEWNLKPGLELFGKTVGILGTGKIGIATAKIFKAFGCEAVGWSRTENEEFKAIGGVYISDKQAFFAAADIVSIHLPLNKYTHGIVSSKELSVMKETAFLVNTARGPIIDEDELIAALQSKKIAGAALDVFAQEPINKDNKLLELDNVILTPHIAYKTEEALKRRVEVTVSNIVNFVQGNNINRVDL